MRVLVVGAGAVGQYIAGRLALGGQEVVLLGRERQAQLLGEAGLTLVDERSRTVVPLRTAARMDDAELQQTFELVVVAVKSYSTAEVAAQLSGLQSCTDASVLTLQNGVGNEEILAEALGEQRVIAGALTVAVDRISETAVRTGPKGGLCFAPLGQAPQNWIMPLLSSSGLRVRAVADWRALKWSKLCINILANAVCAVLDWTPMQVYADRTAFSVERQMLLETIRVIEAQGIDPINLIDFPAATLVHSAKLLPEAVLRVVLSGRVASARGGKLPSLLLDLRAGRPHTEVSALNGAVALYALKNGIGAPTNTKLSELVTAIAASQAAWQPFRNQPAALRRLVDSSIEAVS